MPTSILAEGKKPSFCPSVHTWFCALGSLCLLCRSLKLKSPLRTPRPPYPRLAVCFNHAAGTFNSKVMVGGHSLLLVGLGMALRKLEPDSQESVKGFYKRIWDLFYLEYAMYPFI